MGGSLTRENPCPPRHDSGTQSSFRSSSKTVGYTGSIPVYCFSTVQLLGSRGQVPSAPPLCFLPHLDDPCSKNFTLRIYPMYVVARTPAVFGEIHTAAGVQQYASMCVVLSDSVMSCLLGVFFLRPALLLSGCTFSLSSLAAIGCLPASSGRFSWHNTSK